MNITLHDPMVFAFASALILVAVKAARQSGLPARFGAPAAVVLGMLAAAGEFLASANASWAGALAAGLMSAAAAIGTHELGEAATGKRYENGENQ